MTPEDRRALVRLQFVAVRDLTWAEGLGPKYREAGVGAAGMQELRVSVGRPRGGEGLGMVAGRGGPAPRRAAPGHADGRGRAGGRPRHAAVAERSAAGAGQAHRAGPGG